MPTETPEPPPVAEPARNRPAGSPGAARHRERVPDPEPPQGLWRGVVEFLVVLSLSVMVFRTFAAEAYIVPTGSMAPTLLGQHREILCPNCGFRLILGLDEAGRGGRPVCPNCGQGGLDEARALDSSGDRVLVQKFVFDLRTPRRWEVAVFHFPGDPSQAYVKRVVGLPGESLRIAGGDIWVDGRVARKTLSEQRATRILVFDNNYPPRDADRLPRWRLRRGRLDRNDPSGWREEGTRFVHAADESPGVIDWLEYRHWSPDRNRYGSVHDFYAYNGSDVPGDNVVNDLMVGAHVRPGPDAGALVVRIDSGNDRFQVEIPAGPAGEPLAWRDGHPLPVTNPRPGLLRTDDGPPALLEASVIDHRLTVALDGVLLFDPIDYDDPSDGLGSGDSPVALGVEGGSLTIDDLKVYRDIYYTGNLAFTPRRPFGVDVPYQLGPDEYFVLGDNSPVSNDSRFWPDSPVVPGAMFLGKPFLVHLPGQVVPLRVFGRSLYWVPDPREIRYIR